MSHPPVPPRPRRAFGRLVLAALAGVALLGVVLVLFGGDDDDLSTRPVAISIAGETLTIPANRIRFADQRRGGALDRVDLAVLWPGLDGRTAETRAAFAGTDPAPAAPASATVLHIAIERRAVELDSAARLASVYVRFFAPGEPDAATAPPVDGLIVRRFVAGSPYADETLYFEPGAVHPFVARCFPRASGDARNLCLTEIALGRGLVAAIRFPPALLADWKSLATALAEFLAGLMPK